MHVEKREWYQGERFKVLKVKFVTYPNSNMQNSMIVLFVSILDWKYPFWASLVQKNENCQFQLKFGT